MNLDQLKEELNKVNSDQKRASQKYDYSAIEMGQRVIEARLTRGVTQKSLAKKIGTKQPSIARIERGASMPTIPMLKKIAKALNFPFELPKFVVSEISNTAATNTVNTNVTLSEILNGFPTSSSQDTIGEILETTQNHE